MNRHVLHRPALDALLTVATSDKRWSTRSALASETGFTPQTFANAVAGRRGLSDDAIAAVARVLGIDVTALTVPHVAKPGDLRTVEIEQRLAAVSRELADLAQTVREYQNG